MPNLFISVLQKAEDSSGTVAITLRSLNVDPEQTCTFEVELDGTETERAIARKIQAAALEKFQENDNEFLYDGTPAPASETPPFTFRTLVCDHVVNVWSQHEFTIEVDTGDAISVAVESTPAFVLVSEFNVIKRAVGVNTKPMLGGAALVDDEIISAIAAASAQACATLGKLICAATYVHEEFGGGSDGMTLEETPVVSIDTRVTGSPDFNRIIYGLKLDQTARQTGVIQFGSAGIKLFDVWSSGDVGNYIGISYVSGYTTIPAILKREVVRYTGAQLVPIFASKFKIGTMEVTFADPVKAQEQYDSALMSFNL